MKKSKWIITTICVVLILILCSTFFVLPAHALNSDPTVQTYTAPIQVVSQSDLRWVYIGKRDNFPKRAKCERVVYSSPAEYISVYTDDGEHWYYTLYVSCGESR